MDEQFNINNTTPNIDTSSWNLPMGGSVLPTPLPQDNIQFATPTAQVLDLSPQIQSLVNSVRFDATNSVTRSNPDSALKQMFPDAGKIDTTTFVPRTDTHELLNDGETWIPKYDSYQVGVNNEERIARQQTNFNRFTNTVLRLGENTAKAPLDIASFVYGIGDAAVSGRFDALYDNAFSRYVDDMTTRTNFDYKNYFEESKKNLGFNMYTLDKVGSGAEFTTRMLASEAIIAGLTGGASLPSGFARLGLRIGLTADKIGDITRTGNLLSKMYKTAIKPELQVASQGMNAVRNFERVTQGINTASRTGQWADRLKQIRFATTSPMYEAGFEAMHFRKEAEADFWDYYRNKGTEPSQEDINNFATKMDGASNAVFGLNMGILSISNMAMFGDMLNVKNPLAKGLLGNWSKKIGASVNKNLYKLGTEVGETGVYQAMKPAFWNKTLAYASPFVKGALTEGVYEEGSQGIASGTFKNYVASSYNKDYMNKTRDYVSSFSKAFNDQFSTKEGQEELIIGSLIGGLFGGVGGARQKAREYANQEGVATIQNTGKEFIETFRGNAYTNEQLLSLFSHANRFQDLQAQAEQASRQGDDFKQASKSAESFVSLLNAYHSVGKESEFTEMWANMMQGMDNQNISDTTGIPLAEVDAFKQEQVQNMTGFAQNYSKGRQTAQYLFPRNIGGLTEVDNNGKKVRVNNQNLIDAFSYNYGMSFFNEKFALETFDAFQNNLARVTTNSNLVQEVGALGALRMADANSLRQYNQLTDDLKKNTEKLSQLQEQIVSLQQGEQKTETATNVIDLGRQIESQQRILEQIQSNKKLVWESMIGNFYTQMGKQGGYASEVDLSDFTNYTKRIQSSLENATMKEEDRILLNALLNQFDTANTAFKSYQTVVNNLSNPQLTYKTYAGLFGGKRANLDKSMNDLTRQTLKTILDSEYSTSLNKAMTDYKARPSLITEEVIAQSEEENYVPSEEILSDLNTKTKRQSKLTEKEQRFYDSFKEQIDNYQPASQVAPINDTSERTEITDLKVKIRLKKQQIQDLQNGTYSSELQSKIDALNVEIDELENKLTPNVIQEVQREEAVLKTVFDRIPELSRIFNGNTTLLNNYLNTIFPDSKLKDLFYHGVYDSSNKNDYFREGGDDIRTWNFFYNDIKSALNIGMDPYMVLLNFTADENSTEGEYKNVPTNETADSAIIYETNALSWEYAVKNKNQVYILGSDLDLQNAQNFVNSQSQGDSRNVDTGIKFEKGDFSGALLDNYEFLAEGSESTVYKSKDGTHVIKLSEPYSDGSVELYQSRIESALLGNKILGDGRMQVIGYYEFNGVKNPIYRQDFQSGEALTEQEVIDSLVERGGVVSTERPNEVFIKINNVVYSIRDLTDNYFKDSKGNVVGIDVSAERVENPTITPKNDFNVNKSVQVNSDETGQTEQTILDKLNEIDELESKMNEEMTPFSSAQFDSEVSQINLEIAQIESEIQELEENNKVNPTKVNNQREIQSYRYKQYEYTKKNGDVVTGWIEERNGKTFFVNSQESIYLGQVESTVVTSIPNLTSISEEDIILEGNEIYVKGKIYKTDNLDTAISEDENGNYQVELKHRNGRPIMFTGEVADSIVYQHRLNQFIEQSSNEEINELRRQAEREATIERKYEELISKTEDRVTKQSEQERAHQEYYERLDNLEREQEQLEQTILDKLNEIEDLQTKEQIKLENELLDLQGLLGTQERIDFFNSRIQELSKITEPTESEIRLLNEYRVEVDRLNNLPTAYDPDASYLEQLGWIVNNISELGFESVETLSQIQPPAQETVDRYVELSEKTNRTQSENQELSNLREELLPYNLAEGLEFDGMSVLNLVDLYNQLSAVQEQTQTQMSEVPIQEVFNITRQVQDDQISASGRSARVSLNYDGVVTEFKNGKQTISHVSLTTMLSKALRKDFEPVIKIKDAEGNITETIQVTVLNVEELGEKYDSQDNISVELSPDVQIEKPLGSQTFNTTGSIIDLIDARAYAVTGQGNTYNSVYSQASDGTWVPMESEFEVKVDDLPIMFDRETANSLKPGDKVQLEFNPNDNYNKKLRKNQYASKGNIYIRKNGKLVGVLKAEVERKAGLESWDNLVATRRAVIEAFNNKSSQIELTVANSYLGLPQIVFNEDGSAVQRPIDESRVEAYGYIDENGELQGDIARVKIDNSQYIEPLKKLNKRIPVVAFNYAGQVYGFIVNVAPKSFGFGTEVDTILNSGVTQAEKIIRLNALLDANGLLNVDNAVTNQNFDAENIKNQLSEIQRPVDLTNQTELNEATKSVLIDFADPFLTSKLVLDLIPASAKIETSVTNANENPNVQITTLNNKGKKASEENRCPPTK